jgi:hypothetical protein
MTAVEETEKTKTGLTCEQISKILSIVGILVCFILAFGLAFTSLWYLSFLAGIIGGAFYTKMKHGVLVGMLGVGLGWTFYVIIQISTSSIIELINQVVGIILGNESLGWVIILVIIIVGIIIGALSGTIGSATRILIQNNLKKEESE